MKEIRDGAGEVSWTVACVFVCVVWGLHVCVREGLDYV